jgi:hypothetical protein
MAWRSAIRRTPRDSATVTIAGRPSGIADGQGDRHQERGRQTGAELRASRAPRLEGARREDQRRDGEDQQRDALADDLQLPLQGRRLRLLRLEQVRDAAHLRRLTGLGDDERPSADGDVRAREHHVGPVTERDLGVLERLSVLVRGYALARQRRLVDAKRRGRHESAVRRYAVARGEQDDVAGHELDSGELLLPPVANVGRGRCGHRAQRLHGLLGAVLLREAEDAVEQQDRHDRDGVDDLALECGDDDRDAQHPDHEVIELADEHLPCRRALRRLELVGPVLREALRRVRLRQASRRVGQ